MCSCDPMFRQEFLYYLPGDAQPGNSWTATETPEAIWWIQETAVQCIGQFGWLAKELNKSGNLQDLQVPEEQEKKGKITYV